jgi:predicted nucleic acid-binding protein
MKAYYPIGKTLYSRAVMIDTGAFIALVDPQNSNHQNAVECLNEITKFHLPVFVPLPIIYESYKKMLYDMGQPIAKQFLKAVLSGQVNIVRTIEGDEKAAQGLLERYKDLGLTLSDAASMVLMTRLGIAKSFSFDRHFLQAGFIRIPPFCL